GFHLLWVADRHVAATRADPAFRLEHLQVLIDNLTRHTEKLRELFLGEGQFDCAARRIRITHACEAQQPLRDPRRDTQQSRVLHELRRPANTSAKKADQVGRQLRFRAQQGEELITLENNELRTDHGGRRRGSWLTIEQRDFPKTIAGVNDVEKDLLAPGKAGADADTSGYDSAQGIAWVAPHEDQRPLLVQASQSERGDSGESRLGQAAEQTVALNNGFRGNGQ